jgi:hypothetical protein
MLNFYQQILETKTSNRKLLVILIDGKVSMDNILVVCKEIKIASATHIFVSGNSLIVCNGIHSLETTPEKHASETDLIVIGTTFEKNPNFFKLC